MFWVSCFRFLGVGIIWNVVVAVDLDFAVALCLETFDVVVLIDL